MSDIKIITLLNDVILCMQKQFSYMTFLGIVTAEFEENYSEIEKKIVNFEDPRIKISPVNTGKRPPDVKLVNEESLFGNIGMAVTESDAEDKPMSPQVILTVTNDDDDDISYGDESDTELFEENFSGEDENMNVKNDAGDKNLVLHKTKKGKIKASFFRKFETGRADKPYKCPVCEKLFLHIRSFKAHLHIRELIGKPNYTCQVCSKTLTHLNTYNVHMRSHTGEKPFECDTCHKKFVTPDSIRKHMQIHDGLKPFLCSVCGMAFSQNSSLKAHMRRHTGEKPFTCDTCGETFRAKSNLYEHSLRKHVKKFPYMCEICSSGFINKSNLNQHLRYHTGERPFKCDVCSSKFTTAQHLKRHKLSHKHKMQKEIKNNN